MNKKDKAYIESLVGDVARKMPDYDGDGYPDLFDCDPFDATKDGMIGEAWTRMTSAAQTARQRILRPAAVSGREAVGEVYRRAHGVGAAARAAAATRVSRAREFVRAPPAVRAERIVRGKEAFIKARKPDRPISDISKRIHEETARVAKVARGFEKQVDPYARDIERALGFHKAAIPKPVRWAGEQAKQLGYGIAFHAPAAAVEMAGMMPAGVETIARRPKIVPAAAALGLYMMGESAYKGFTTAPGRTAGEFIGIGAIAKGIGEVPKISPYYRGRDAGVKVYTGEPSWLGRMRGKKPHPTPEARMGEMLDPSVYSDVQKFYHGTSMGFVERIVKAGEMPIRPEAVSLRGPPGVEASLFLSKPGTPYARFATPQRIAKIGVGETAREMPVFQLEQMMRGKMLRAEGIKPVKPSKGLSELIAKREKLSGELAGLEMSKLAPLSPKRMATEAKLYDTMRAAEKMVVKEYKTATGEKITVRDRPGAFLEIEQRPFRLSEKLIEKAKKRESLRDREKAGTITKPERAKLRALEMELKKETAAEYFEAPLGEVVPGPKPIYGYEWKGITEAEFVVRAGTKLYPTTTARSQAYALLGIKKGTHFTQDTSTGRWMEILRVTTDPSIATPPKHLIDVPKIIEPFRPSIPKVRKLSTKQKSEIVRTKKQITEAEKVGDFDKSMRLSDRIRQIETGRPMRRIAAPVRRVPRPDLPRMTERDIPRMTERDIPRMTERDISRMFEREPTRPPSRDVMREPGRDVGRDPLRDVMREPGRDVGRDPLRDVMREPGRDVRITTRFVPFDGDKIVTTTTTYKKKKDKKKIKKREAKPEMAVGWKQKEKLITLESLLDYKQ